MPLQRQAAAAGQGRSAPVFHGQNPSLLVLRHLVVRVQVERRRRGWWKRLLSLRLLHLSLAPARVLLELLLLHLLLAQRAGLPRVAGATEWSTSLHGPRRPRSRSALGQELLAEVRAAPKEVLLGLGLRRQAAEGQIQPGHFLLNALRRLHHQLPQTYLAQASRSARSKSASQQPSCSWRSRGCHIVVASPSIPPISWHEFLPGSAAGHVGRTRKGVEHLDSSSPASGRGKAANERGWHHF